MNKVTKGSLVVLIGVLFLSVGNVFGINNNNRFNAHAYFAGNGTLPTMLQSCNEGAHSLFKKQMTNTINKDLPVQASAQQYVNALSDLAKNCDSCNAEYLNRVAMHVFNSTIHSLV